MKNYRVRYYYLETGMDGIPDERDYGYWEAGSVEEAKDKATRTLHPDCDEYVVQQIKQCLSARE